MEDFMSNTITTNALLGTAEWLSPTGPRTAPLTAALLGESIFDADPVRKGNQYSRQRNFHGHYFFTATGKHVWHESLLERASLMLLDHAADVVAVAAQPVLLRVGDRTHVPDILVLHRDGTQTLFDVKPASLLTPRTREQFEMTKTVCRQVGWSYRVLTERVPQTRVNLDYLAQFRQDEYECVEMSTVTAQYRDGWTVADLVDAVPAATTTAARAYAMNILWQRELAIDMGPD